MTYEHYINQPMQMIERVLNRKYFKYLGMEKMHLPLFIKYMGLNTL